MSYNLVDARSQLPFPVEDLNSEDAVSNVSSFDTTSQDYSSATQGSTLNNTQPYSLIPPRRSSHQLQESQKSELRTPDLSHKEARNRNSATKTVASLETRARWAMLRSLVGAAEAEEETERGGDSGDRDHKIESRLLSGEAGYQASDKNPSREESDSYRSQDHGIAVVPSGLSVPNDILTTSRDDLADSTPSATNEAATIERYLHNLSKDPRIDIRGLSASLPGGRTDRVEKDFNALAGPVENVLRADAQGLERIVHSGKENVENADDQASLRSVERALYADGKRIGNKADGLGKRGGQALEKDAHEIKKAFEKGEGLVGAHGLERALHAGGKRIENAADSLEKRGEKVLERDAHEIKKAFKQEEGSIGPRGLEPTLHAGAESIENAVGSFGKRAGNNLDEHAHKIKRAVEREEEGLSTGAHRLERVFHVEDERIKNDARSLGNRARRALEDDAQETRKIIEEGEGLFSGADGLKRGFHMEEERIKNDASFLGNKAKKALEKDAHETTKIFEKGEGLLKDAHGLERAIHKKGQELNNNIGYLGSETGRALSKEAHEITQGLEKGKEGLVRGVHGLERAIHTKGHELGDDIGDLGRDSGKVIGKEAHEIKQFLGKEEGGLKRAVHTTGHEISKDFRVLGRDSGEVFGKEAHEMKQRLGREEVGLKRAIHTKDREIRNDIGDAGRNTGEFIRIEAREIKNSLDGAGNSVMGSQTPLQTAPRGPSYASQPLRTSNPSAGSRLNAQHQEKQMGFPSSYGLPSGAERSRPTKQSSLSNAPRPSIPSTKPQAFAQPQSHVNMPTLTRSPLASPNARGGRPISPALTGMQQRPISHHPNAGPRNQQADDKQIPPPQASQRQAIPLQEEQFSRPSDNGAISRPTNISQDQHTRPLLPSPGPAPRTQQIPSSIPAPSGTTIVEPANIVGPSLHQPLSLVPGFSDSHLMPTEQTTGSLYSSVSPPTNQDTRESSRPQFQIKENSSMAQDSQHTLRPHQSPSNASLRTSDSSAPSTSTESTIPRQSTASTEPLSATIPPHPLAVAFEHAITGFKQRTEAGIAARRNKNPGFHESE